MASCSECGTSDGKSEETVSADDYNELTDKYDELKGQFEDQEVELAEAKKRIAKLEAAMRSAVSASEAMVRQLEYEL